MSAADTKLAGRVALVTGASSGIGRATALRLARSGAALGLTGRRPGPLEAVREEVLAAGGRAVAIAGDVRDADHVRTAVDETVSAWGSLDVLVNNAGVIGSGLLVDTSEAEWDRLLDIDLKGPFLFARAAIPHLMRGTHPSIVNISSVTGRRPYVGVGPYCVAKAGLDMLTQCLALELAPHGVRVNAINPGVVVSNLHTATGTVPDYEAFLARSANTHPLGFVGEPRDVAEAVLFLVADESRWITGALLPLDGGRALTSLR